jgi:hypothetical protein
MIRFDVSDIVLQSDNIYERHIPKQGWKELVKWLDANIGGVINGDVIRHWTDGTVIEGRGWCVECITTTEKDGANDDMQIISWDLCIEDEAKATLYALRWVK